MFERMVLLFYRFIPTALMDILLQILNMNEAVRMRRNGQEMLRIQSRFLRINGLGLACSLRKS